MRQFKIRCAWLAFVTLASCRRDEPSTHQMPRAEPPPPPTTAQLQAPAVNVGPSSTASATTDKPILTPEEEKRRATFDASLARGRRAARNGRHAEAISAFTEAVKANPQDPRALAERGHAKLLADDPDGAKDDLDDALLRSADPDLLSQIWFNLGLVREKTKKDDDSVRVAFANAHLLKPSAATRSKLAGKSTCTVEITRDGLEPMVAADGWLEVYDIVGPSPQRAELVKDKPATDKLASTLICSSDIADELCSETEPFRLLRNHLLYFDQVFWVIPRKKKNQFWVYSAGSAGCWPARCTGLMTVDATFEGDIARFRLHNDGSLSAFEGGEVNDEGRCKDGVSWTDEIFLDMTTGNPIASVRWTDRSQTTIRVEGRKVILSGGGCNERLSL